MSWYLTVFFLVLMLLALFVPTLRPGYPSYTTLADSNYVGHRWETLKRDQRSASSPEATRLERHLRTVSFGLTFRGSERSLYCWFSSFI